MGKRGNVEISNSPQVGFEQGPVDLKFSTLQNELKRYPSSSALVVVLVNPRLDIQRYSDILFLSLTSFFPVVEAGKDLTYIGVIIVGGGLIGNIVHDLHHSNQNHLHIISNEFQ